MKKLITNKKGGGYLNVVLIVGILFMIMIIGLIIAFGGMTVKWTIDQIAPELSSLGMAGDANLSKIATYIVTPAQNVIDSITWLSGVIYILSIIIMFGLAFAFKVTGNKWLMAIFVACMLLVIIGSIFISNIYQDFYEDTGEIGTELHNMVLLSFLLLNSPIIITIVGFVCGIIMFSGIEEEGYAY